MAYTETPAGNADAKELLPHMRQLHAETIQQALGWLQALQSWIKMSARYADVLRVLGDSQPESVAAAIGGPLLDLVKIVFGEGNVRLLPA